MVLKSAVQRLERDGGQFENDLDLLEDMPVLCQYRTVKFQNLRMYLKR